MSNTHTITLTAPAAEAAEAYGEIVGLSVGDAASVMVCEFWSDRCASGRASGKRSGTTRASGHGPLTTRPGPNGDNGLETPISAQVVSGRGDRLRRKGGGVGGVGSDSEPSEKTGNAEIQGEKAHERAQNSTSGRASGQNGPLTADRLTTRATTRARAEDVPIPDELATDRFRSVWAEWLTHRRQLRNPATPVAARRQLARCVKRGHDAAVEAIEHSMEQGWTGIYPPGKDKASGRSIDDILAGGGQ